MFKSTFNSSQHQSSMENNNTLNPNSFEALNINTEFVSDNRHRAKNIGTEENSFHWSSQVLESVVILDGSGELPFGVAGGASEDCMCLVEGINQDRIRYEKGQLNPGDLILEVQGEKVAGFIVQDLLEFLWSLDTSGGVVALKTISEEFLPKRLTQHLGLKFPKDSKDHQLQQTIRRNIYKRALPYTTRPPREGELDGVDYKFLSVEEFLELERTGKLLEKGVYEGNYYGTPRPDVVVSHIIPWNGLPEHLYSMVGKHNSTAVASAAGAASTTLTTFCSSTSPSSSNNSSANTTLLSPMIKREVETITQSGARDNEDVLNNNNSSNNVNNVSITSQQYTPPSRPAPRSNQFHPDAVCSQPDLDPSDPCYGTQLITTILVKGARGLGFTIVGIEDEDSGEVWLVVKNVMEGGPADVDGKLRRGDILMRVDGRSICGMSHAGVVQMFRGFEVNQSVAMEVLRTPNSSNLELLDLEPCDPSLEVITAVGVGCRDEFRRLGIDIVKGKSGFGFTLADRPEGQKVKQLVDQERCRGLEEGDLLLQINDHPLGGLLHNDVVNFLKACPVDKPARFLIERRVPSRSNSSLSPGHKVMNGGTNLHGNLTSTFRNSPTSSFRPLSAGVGSRASPLDLRHHVAATSSLSTPPPHHVSNSSSPSSASQGPNHQAVSPAPLNLSKLPYFSNPCNQRTPDFIPASAFVGCPPGSVNPDQSSRNTRRLDLIPTYSGRRPYSPFDAHLFRHPQAYLDPHLHFQQQQQQHYQQQYMPAGCCVPAQGHHPSSCESLHFSETYHHFHSPVLHQKESPQTIGGQGNVRYVTLKRSQNGFGFRIVGGREEGTQVSVGYIVPGGPAQRDGQLRVGQEILSVDGRTVMGAWHKEIVDLVTSAGQKGEITIGVRESDPYYDPKGMPSQEVILSRADGDGFGFYILSSGMNVGSVIGRILENSPASRAEALRVGDRILAINDTSIHGMKHEQIVELIKSSGKTIKLTVSEGTQPHHPPVHQSGGMGIRDNSPCLSISARNTSSPNNSSPPQQPLFPPPPLGSTCCQYPRHDHLPHSQLCDVIHVELIRGAKGFGFSIRGGQDFGLPVYILKVTEEGPARADGRIQAGDEILKINGHPTAGLSHKEAINLVQSSAHKLSLVLRRVNGLESSGDL